jgi:hypothetical protein
MNVSEISFCGHIGFNIKSDEAKQNILNKLENYYGIKIVAKHYEKFTNDNADKLIKNINNNLHLICTRTNGNPYFLYLVKINFTNYCIFIDKKIQQGYYYPRMIISHIFFDDILFDKDILFDGEMIKLENEKWIYMVNDLIVNDNKYLLDMNLVKRINLCYDLLGKYYHMTNTDLFKIMVKKYFKYDELTDILDNFVPSRKYTCRGLYFKPLYLKFKDILINFDDSLVCKVERIKYKNVKNFLLSSEDIKEDKKEDKKEDIKKEENLRPEYIKPLKQVETIVSKEKTFMVKKTSQPDVYELYSDNIFVDMAYIPNLKTSKKMREKFMDINLVSKISLVCNYSDKFNKWYPVFEE